MALTLHYAPGACSLASHIALAESGAPFELARVDFGRRQQRSPEYLAVNPKGRVPALVHDGFVVTENPAILRYVSRLYPGSGLWPFDPRADARCAEWLAWLSSGLHPTYAHVRRAERYASTESGKADVVETGRAATRKVYAEVEQKLASAGTLWAAGPGYSVADGYLFTFWTWGRTPTLAYDMVRDFPAWSDHARRMGERAPVQRALAAEGLAAP